nr:hypothetical protein CFP56_46497 [Quercus suber]
MRSAICFFICFYFLGCASLLYINNGCGLFEVLHLESCSASQSDDGKVQKDASPAQNPLDFNCYLKGTLVHQEIQVQQECEYGKVLIDQGELSTIKRDVLP